MACLSHASMSASKLHDFCRMIAGFGSGAAFSLVSGMTQGNPLQGAFSTGVLFALLQGGFYQVRVCALLHLTLRAAWPVQLAIS